MQSWERAGKVFRANSPETEAGWENCWYCTEQNQLDPQDLDLDLDLDLPHQLSVQEHFYICIWQGKHLSLFADVRVVSILTWNQTLWPSQDTSRQGFDCILQIFLIIFFNNGLIQIQHVQVSDNFIRHACVRIYVYIYNSCFWNKCLSWKWTLSINHSTHKYGDFA